MLHRPIEPTGVIGPGNFVACFAYLRDEQLYRYWDKPRYFSTQREDGRYYSLELSYSM